MLIESHASLARDFEVTTEHLDYLVEVSQDFPGVCGARMTGGGFGGATIVMLSPDILEDFSAHIAEQFRKRFHITPEALEIEADAGGGIVNSF